MRAVGEGDPFQRLAVEATFEYVRPCDAEPAIGGLQRNDANSAFGEHFRPCAIRAEVGPARAAQRQHGRVGLDIDRAIREVILSAVTASGPNAASNRVTYSGILEIRPTSSGKICASVNRVPRISSTFRIGPFA